MADRPERERVLQIRRDLEALGARVPGRAQGFHARLQAVLRRIGGELAESWWMSRKRFIEEIALDADHLETLASGLGALFSRASEIGRNADRLRADAARIEDEICVAWVSDWHAHWHVRIPAIGITVEKPAELERDALEIQEIEVQLSAITETVSLLLEGQTLRARFPSSNPALQYVGDLMGLRDRLRAEGHLRAWQAELAACLKPLRTKASEPAPEAPSGLSGARTLAREVERWIPLLDVAPDSAVRTMAHIERAISDPDLWGEASVLLTRVQSQVTKLRSEAEKRRTEKEAHLREDLQLYASACGHNQALAEEQRHLFAIPRGEPHNHERWIEAVGVAENALLQEIGSRSTELRRWIAARKEGISDKLKALDTRTLFDAQARERLHIVDEIGRATVPPGQAHETLAALRDLGRWSAAAEHLQGEADRAGRDAAARQAHLRERHTFLAKLEEEVGIPVPVFEQAPTEGVAAQGTGAEDVFRALDEQDKALRDRESKILRACEVGAREDTVFANRLFAVARKAEPNATPPPSTVWPATPTLNQAVDVHRVSKKTRTANTALAGALLQRLLARREALLGKIGEALVRTDVAPDHRSRAEDLRDLLQANAGAGADVLDSAEKLQKRLAEVDLLLEEISADEIESVRLRESLDASWARLAEDGLSKHIPDPTKQRIKALVNGVSARSRHWGASRSQLQEAQSLLVRASRHAGAIAATDFEADRTAIEERCGRDPTFAAQIAALLDEIRDCSTDLLPPPDLRARVAQTAKLARPQR